MGKKIWPNFETEEILFFCGEMRKNLDFLYARETSPALVIFKFSSQINLSLGKGSARGVFEFSVMTKRQNTGERGRKSSLEQASLQFPYRTSASASSFCRLPSVAHKRRKDFNSTLPSLTTSVSRTNRRVKLILILPFPKQRRSCRSSRRARGCPRSRRSRAAIHPRVSLPRNHLRGRTSWPRSPLPLRLLPPSPQGSSWHLPRRRPEVEELASLPQKSCPTRAWTQRRPWT